MVTDNKMLEINKIYNIDVLEGLKLIENNKIDLIITSPPYNKCGLNGKQKGTKWNGTIDYGGDVNVDNLPEDEYQKWQIEILNECYRILKPYGSMFYNHKNRIHNGEIITPYQWILQSKFKIRQEIIWDRGSTNNVHRCRYLPTTEKIFWLTKSSKPLFDRKLTTKYKTEVWNFPFEKGTKHPAPFPINLPDNIIDCIQTDNQRLLILDPFMGSGTVALSALKHNCDYIGFEKFQEYIQMSNDRINNHISLNIFDTVQN